MASTRSGITENQAVDEDCGDHPKAADAKRKVNKAAIQKFDTAVKSTWFWTYLDFLLVVAGSIEQMSSWTELCPCHGADSKAHRRCRPSAQRLEQHFVVSGSFGNNWVECRREC